MAVLYTLRSLPHGLLSLMPCPTGNDALADEMTYLRDRAVDIVVSLQPADEAARLGLADEGAACEAMGITYESFPIIDRQIPTDREAVHQLCQRLANAIDQGKHVAIHCKVGVGRSGVIAACTLIVIGFTATEAIDTLSMVRGHAIPDTDAQREWIYDFARRYPPKGRWV